MENNKDKSIDKNKRDFKEPNIEKLEQAYRESLERLGLTEQASEPEKHGKSDEESEEVFEKMLEEVARRRRANKSIWTDEPVIPVRKSIWLDGGEDADEPTSPERNEPPQKPLKPITAEEPKGQPAKKAFVLKIPKEYYEGFGVPGTQDIQRNTEEYKQTRASGFKQTVEINIGKTASGAAAEEEPAKADNAGSDRSAKAEKENEGYKDHDLEFNFINSVLCILLIFGVGIALVVMHRESGFIDSENRNLAEFPKFSISSYLSGEFTSGITEYYTDTIPNRENLKKFSSVFSDILGIHINDVKIKGDVSVVEKEQLDENKKATTTTVTAFTGSVTTKKTSETTTTASKKKTTTSKKKEEPKLDDGAWAGNVVVAGSGKNVRAMSAFYGIFENGEKYAQAVNSYKEALGGGVNVYNMSIPLSSAFYMPDNLKDSFSDQKDCIENIGLNLSGVIDCNVYAALEKHTDEYIYSRTDHHWQPRGAYYAAQVFAQKAGVDFPALSAYEKCEIEGFVGTMYAYSDYDEELNENPDTFIYYKPDNDYTVKYYDTAFENGYEGSLFFDYASGVNCYSAILNKDEQITEITTDCENGRVLVIMKDSYGNALVPFLTHSFSKIYVCDFRYMDINAKEFMENVGATDVLFSISLSACYTPSHIEALEEDLIK
ncbi:DHHW family protein [Ruminococcus sp. Marseille-P6503]|uniref:DHHW family protein n=1 Tax=Ruminococcus sp. Marseille-P6503 TaxID=2364796 RepID=UPI000F5311D6|nr:DHHW family protein [Ruminococcus sp. Marseille-P6503]